MNTYAQPLIAWNFFLTKQAGIWTIGSGVNISTKGLSGIKDAGSPEWAMEGPSGGCSVPPASARAQINPFRNSGRGGERSTEPP